MPDVESKIDIDIKEGWAQLETLIALWIKLGLKMEGTAIVATDASSKMREALDQTIMHAGGLSKLTVEVQKKLMEEYGKLNAGVVTGIEAQTEQIKSHFGKTVDYASTTTQNALSKLMPSKEFLKLGIWGLILGSIVGVVAEASEEAGQLNLSLARGLGSIVGTAGVGGKQLQTIIHGVSDSFKNIITDKDVQKVYQNAHLFAEAAMKSQGGLKEALTDTIALDKFLGKSVGKTAEEEQAWAQRVTVSYTSKVDYLKRISVATAEYTKEQYRLIEASKGSVVSTDDFVNTVMDLSTRLGDLGLSISGIGGLYGLMTSAQGGIAEKLGMSPKTAGEAVGGILGAGAGKDWFTAFLGKEALAAGGLSGTPGGGLGIAELEAGKRARIGVLQGTETASMQPTVMLKALDATMNAMNLKGKSSDEIQAALEYSLGMNTASAMTLAKLYTEAGAKGETLADYVKEQETAGKITPVKAKELIDAVASAEPPWMKLIKNLEALLKDLVITITNLMTTGIMYLAELVQYIMHPLEDNPWVKRAADSLKATGAGIENVGKDLTNMGDAFKGVVPALAPALAAYSPVGKMSLSPRGPWDEPGAGQGQMPLTGAPAVKYGLPSVNTLGIHVPITVIIPHAQISQSLQNIKAAGRM